jgi:hypothetical protein
MHQAKLKLNAIRKIILYSKALKIPCTTENFYLLLLNRQTKNCV